MELRRRAASPRNTPSKHTSFLRSIQGKKTIGTLVITVSCTHKNVKKYTEPAYNSDLLLRAYNELFPQSQLPMEAREIWTKYDELKDKKEADKNQLHILTGFTHGSSFIGSVTFFLEETTTQSQDAKSIAQQLDATAKYGNWLAKVQGNIGFSSQAANQIQQLMSSSQMSSYLYAEVAGIIPTLASTMVQQSVKGLASFNQNDAAALNAMLDNTVTSAGALEDASQKAMGNNMIVQVQMQKMKTTFAALEEIDKSSNQVYDLSSLTRALDDYIGRANGTTSGVPLNYYYDTLQTKDVLKLWLEEKGYPLVHNPFTGADESVQDKTTKNANPK